MYNHSHSSVGSNKKHIQITPKYRYEVINNLVVKTSCRVSIEEVCKRHKIKIEILKVKEEHAHMIIDCPRTMSDAKLMQLIKGGSSFMIFRLCPELEGVYPKREFWKCKIYRFLKERLKIELHPEKSKIISLSKGIDFVGFRNYWYFRLLRKRNIRVCLINLKNIRLER